MRSPARARRASAHIGWPCTARWRSTTPSRARWSCWGSARRTCAPFPSTGSAGCARTRLPRRSSATWPRASHRSPSSQRRARRSRARSTRSAAIADVCAARKVWVHVDGAYGLPAAGAASVRPALFRRARARGLGERRRPQVALPAEGLRHRARARGRRPGQRVRPRAGVPAAPAARAARRRHHAGVLASVPGAEAVAGVPRARCRAVPRLDRAQPRRGPVAV